MKPAFAAIDCGSNTVRMMTVDETGRLVHNEIATTRLGRSIPSTGAMDGEAVESTLAAFTEFAALADGAQMVAVATSAVRDASNATSFLHSAAAVLGIPVQIISGEEEGELALLGASNGDPAPLAVLDIGGGSTELSIRTDGRVEVLSMQVGCVRLSATDWAAGSRSQPMTADLTSVLTRALAVLTPLAVPLVAVGGTAVSLAAYDLGLKEYRRGAADGHLMNLQRLVEIKRELASMTEGERHSHPSIPPGRADVIVSGAVILSEVLRRLDIHRYRTSEKGLLDGLILNQFGVMIDWSSPGG